MKSGSIADTVFWSVLGTISFTREIPRGFLMMERSAYNWRQSLNEALRERARHANR